MASLKEPVWQLWLKKLCFYMSKTGRIELLQNEKKKESDSLHILTYVDSQTGKTIKLFEGYHLKKYFQSLKKDDLKILERSPYTWKNALSAVAGGVNCSTIENLGCTKEHRMEYDFVHRIFESLTKIQHISSARCVLNFLIFCQEKHFPIRGLEEPKSLQEAIDLITAELAEFEDNGESKTPNEQASEGVKQETSDEGSILTVTDTLPRLIFLPIYDNSETKGGGFTLSPLNHNTIPLQGRVAEWRVLDTFLNEAQGQTQASTELTPPFRQIKLSLPAERPRDINYYGTQAVKILGRDEEIKQIRAFLNCEEKFAWFQLAGAAGQGKSRLALNFVLEYREKGWNAGLLESKAINDLGEDGWKTWLPEKPHLMVVDYVIGRTDEINIFFQTLASRKKEFKHNVRLLLIERQPWESLARKRRVGDTGEFSFNTDMTETRAHWYIDLTSNDNDNVVSKTRFKSGVLELEQLDESQLLEITTQVTRIISPEKGLITDGEIKKRLKQIDSAGRPLYAYFLGQELAHDVDTRGWSRNDLLNAALTRERERWWKALFEGEPPRYEDDTPATRLAVLATMTDGVNCIEACNKKHLLPKANSATRTQALALTGGNLYSADDISGAPQFIPSIQPDLLGEWYVLRCFEEGLPLQELTGIALEYSPKKVAAFIIRAIQDFGQYSILQEMLQNIDYKDFEIIELNKVLATALHYLYIFPPKLVNSLEQHLNKTDCTDEDHTMSMLFLALCYQDGIGVEKDIQQAFAWYQKAADADEPLAMFGLGVCYAEGNGVEQNWKQALIFYEKAAILGHVEAMFNLGNCFRQGDGVETNRKQAAIWYHKAADAGHIEAMHNFALCNKNGHGVRRDSHIACVWYQKAADAGHAGSMFNLGNCYAKGDGVEEDREKACVWYHKAADAGLLMAMQKLVVCYAKGDGVTQDLKKAAFWNYQWERTEFQSAIALLLKNQGSEL